jgi:asparagine synthase (glutamine-hydrolysing)
MMVLAQLELGPHDQAISSGQGVAMGRCLYRALPEDRNDKQPFIDHDLMVVADARIDNRDEILNLLAMRAGAEVADAELLFRSYQKWRERFVDHVVGDFALAAWSFQERDLTLVRDPTGQRPLHYNLRGDAVAFATVPKGLCALPWVDNQVDERRVAKFIADMPRLGPTTFFEGVSRVEPGCIVKISGSGVRSESYWHMPDRELRYPRESDYVESFHEHLDRAVGARLRGAGGTVGAHLSGGFDSSAVTATAARSMSSQSGKVIAFTSAPRQGFAGVAPRGRISDESHVAASVAAMYPNIEHVIIRSDGSSPLSLTRRDGARFEEPIGLPCNQVWWSAIHDAARDRGINVLLTGEAGNLTISAGSLSILAEMIRRGRWLSWVREVRALKGSGPRMRGLIASSFAPWLPEALWRSLHRHINGQSVTSVGLAILTRRWKSALAEEAESRSRAGRPAKIERISRWKQLQASDPGNFRKGVLAGWGIDERDPTTDRRLAEFCLSLPPEQLLKGGVARRMARLGLADRLPIEVLYGPRGYQGADWYELVGADMITSEIEALRQQGTAGSVLDFDQLLNIVGSWPDKGWEQEQVMQTFRMGLLRALSAAHFMGAVETKAASRAAST